MPLLISPDRCACRRIHADDPGDWPACPEHGHWLQLLRITDDGFTYSCPARAPKCAYTHTQREKATMTVTAEAATAALAIRTGQDAWTPKQVAALEQLGIEGAPEAHLQVFFDVCQITGLNPFAKQIRLRKDRQRDANGDWQEQWSIETEIDGYRVIAARAAKREGVTLSSGPPLWFDLNERKHEIWASDDLPAGAEYTVHKDGQPFTARVSFKSFAKRTKQGNLMAQWAVMPDHMIAIRAESHALRKAFPHDLEGVSLNDGTPDADPAPPRVIQQRPVQPPRAKASANGNRQALVHAIRAEFDRLGLDDSEERAVYVNRLNNLPADAAWTDLTDKQLAVALETLSEKDDDGNYEVPDIAALVELCNPEPATP